MGRHSSAGAVPQSVLDCKIGTPRYAEGFSGGGWWGSGFSADDPSEFDGEIVNDREGLARRRQNHLQRNRGVGGPALFTEPDAESVVVMGVRARLVLPRRDRGFRPQQFSIQRRDDRAQRHYPNR